MSHCKQAVLSSHHVCRLPKRSPKHLQESRGPASFLKYLPVEFQCTEIIYQTYSQDMVLSSSCSKLMAPIPHRRRVRFLGGGRVISHFRRSRFGETQFSDRPPVQMVARQFEEDGATASTPATTNFLLWTQKIICTEHPFYSKSQTKRS